MKFVQNCKIPTFYQQDYVVFYRYHTDLSSSSRSHRRSTLGNQDRGVEYCGSKIYHRCSKKFVRYNEMSILLSKKQVHGKYNELVRVRHDFGKRARQHVKINHKKLNNEREISLFLYCSCTAALPIFFATDPNFTGLVY